MTTNIYMRQLRENVSLEKENRSRKTMMIKTKR